MARLFYAHLCTFFSDDIHYKFLIPLLILTAMDASSIILGAGIFYRNKKIYKEAFISGTHGLTARYQTCENIKTTRYAFMLVMLHFWCQNILNNAMKIYLLRKRNIAETCSQWH